MKENSQPSSSDGSVGTVGVSSDLVLERLRGGLERGTRVMEFVVQVARTFDVQHRRDSVETYLSVPAERLGVPENSERQAHEPDCLFPVRSKTCSFESTNVRDRYSGLKGTGLSGSTWQHTA